MNEMNDPNWCTIGEYALSDTIIADHGEDDFMAGALFRSLEAAGLSQEICYKIAQTVTKSSRETGRQNRGDGYNKPLTMRLYCQSVLLDCLTHPEKQAQRGWGIYVIEKCRYTPGADNDLAQRSVDVYLYQEGD